MTLGKMFANYVSGKALIFRICKELKKMTTKTTQLSGGQRIRTFLRRNENCHKICKDMVSITSHEKDANLNTKPYPSVKMNDHFQKGER